MLLYLTIDGQEQVALGKDPHSWHFNVRMVKPEYETTDVFLGEITANLPSKESCMEPVLKKLKAKEQEIQAEAYKELMAIKSRRDALLCLTMEPSNVE